MAVVSAQDMAALQGMFQGASNIPWATLLGFANPGQQPAPGTATLGAEQAAGMFTNSPFAGNPTLAAQEAGGFFGPNMGVLSGLPTTAQEQISGLTTNGYTPTAAEANALGYFGGLPTESMQQTQGYTYNPNGILNDSQVLQNQRTIEEYSHIAPGTTPLPRMMVDPATGAYVDVNSLSDAQAVMARAANAPGARSPTLQRELGMGNLGLGLLNLVGSLKGPENAFQQQNVLHGINAAGLSNAVDAIGGRTELPSVQAPQAQSRPMNLSSLFGQVAGATSGGGWAGSGAGYAQPLGGSALSTNQQAYANALPDPNKIVGRNFLQLDPDTQKFLLGAYGSLKGYSDSSVMNAVDKGLPAFKAPDIGLVSA